ncbi:MAG: CDP-alcohol phosphatidyltransferase family protein [Bifidobacteriaceae bacterium]|jgi:cardiolipin synthase|nr:CDP-alcohol phosphatidyltransferase family protein [Bifidobacteriaceae bacterium]
MKHKIWTIPNLISFLRILAIIPLCYFIISDQDLYVLLLVIASGLSDYLDGFIARRFNQASKLGQVLDPIADRLYILFLIIFLVVDDKLPLVIFFILLAREALVGILQLWFSHFRIGAIPVSFLGKASTALLLYSLPIIYLSKMIDTTSGLISSLGWAVVIWAVVLHIIAGVHYFYLAYKFSKTRTQEKAKTE